MERTLFKASDIGKRDLSVLKSLGCCAAGLVLSLTRLSGYPSPFAAAALSCVSGMNCIFMFVGAAVGYAINGGLRVCVPYIAAMGIILIARMATTALLMKARTGLIRIVQSAVTGACVFIANIFTAEGVYDIFIAAAFAVISAIFSFCADKLSSSGFTGLLSERSIPETAALGIVFVSLTAAFTSLQAGPLNLGIFISTLSVLYASEVNIEAAASVCAVLSAAGAAAADAEFAAPCVLISVTAPVIMLIEKRSRVTKACAFILTVGAGLILTGLTEAGGIAAMSACAAAAVYIAVPERFTIAPVITRHTRAKASARPYAAFGRKLGSMSDTIEEMRAAVIKTAKALETENIRDISWVYSKAADSVCGSCPSGMKCWGQLYNETADIMNKAVLALRGGSFVSEGMLDGHLTAGCGRKSELAAALNKQYAVYCSAESASHKVTEMRSVLTSQLGATGTMLRKMSDELSRNDTYDESAALTAETTLTELGMQRPSVIALTINDRLSIDAYCGGSPDFPPEELADRLSISLHKEFDLPMISTVGDKVHITISERARFDAQIKVFRKNRSGARHSGDCADCFNDGKGSVYMILSDGMGTGSRARIDSAFSCGMLVKLLKAGIDLDSSLEMLNTSLLVKSSDESFATMDICRIDLNTGDAMLCKAGAAATYVRCGNTFAAVSEDGLPLGTGFEAKYRGKLFRVSEGDIIIMASDGAILDKGWLEQLVMRERKPDLDRIMNTIGEALRFTSDKETEDDMTVIGVKLIR